MFKTVLLYALAAVAFAANSGELITRPSTHVVPYTNTSSLFPSEIEPKPYNSFDNFYTLDTTSSTGPAGTTGFERDDIPDSSTTGAAAAVESVCRLRHCGCSKQK
jgi:hypothetical protein